MRSKNRLFLMPLFILFCLLISVPSGAQKQMKIEHGPYLQNLYETEVTIVWVASLPSVGWVEIAPDDASSFYQQERPRFFDTTNGVKNTSLIHRVRIEGLQPGVRYRYRVYSKEVLEHQGNVVLYGRQTGTDVYGREPLSFVTNSHDKESTSFIVLNDIHGRSNDVPELMKVAQSESTDLCFFNGDMVSHMQDEEQIFSGFMDDAVKHYGQEKPIYYARGNHETRGKFATSFQSYFSPLEKNLYFSFRQGPVYFIVLDGGEDKPDSDIEYYGITDYDRYRDTQAEWLKEVVKSPEFREAPCKIVICHMPPLTSDRKVWHGQTEILKKFVPILNEGGIDLMISGHLHTYMENKTGTELRFPVLVNPHNTVLKATADKNKIEIRILNKEGNVVADKSYPL